MNEDIRNINVRDSEIQDGWSVINDLRTGYCPVCKSMERRLFRYYTKWPSGFINDEHTIEEYASVHGFCPPHSWQLESFSSNMATAHGYPALLEKIAYSLDNPKPGVFDKLKKGPDDCLVCIFLKEKEKENINNLICFLQDENSRKQYSEFMGLCIRHLHLIIQDIDNELVTNFLREHASRKLKQLIQNLNVYKIKMNELKRGELSKDEERSAHLSIALVFGLRSLSPYFCKNGEI